MRVLVVKDERLLAETIAGRNPALTPSLASSSPQDVTRGRQRREEKGHFCETREYEDA